MTSHLYLHGLRFFLISKLICWPSQPYMPHPMLWSSDPCCYTNTHPSSPVFASLPAWRPWLRHQPQPPVQVWGEVFIKIKSSGATTSSLTSKSLFGPPNLGFGWQLTCSSVRLLVCKSDMTWPNLTQPSLPTFSTYRPTYLPIYLPNLI